MLGTRLRELRKSQGLSLRQLAQETNLSATLLSQIERGVTEPSLKSLRLIAGVFGQSISKLFDEDRPPDVFVSRAGARSYIRSPTGTIQYERIMPGNPDLTVLRGILDPGASSSEEQWAHTGVECAYVVTGVLTVHVLDATYEVSAGDAITLNSRQPHRYSNTTDEQTDFILSVTPPNP